IIMAQQQQHAADVHPNELCPPNKRYDLIDANKKFDLDHFWYTLKEDGSKYRLKFMLDKKDLTLILDDFRIIFHLPQATDNNHNSFVPPPSFSDMPWQTLCKIVSKCLTTRVTGWDQPPLQIMQMMYFFVHNIHVDYAELLWEGIYYFLHHPTSSIPYPRFTKIIVSHYMTIFLDISRRARDKYHNLQDDDIMKNIFNSGRHKDKVGMQIPAWMITEEMKHMEHYRMYAKVFGIDVPLTQRSTRLTPPAPLPTIDKADEMILQDILQVSLAEHKSREDQEARENVELVNKHLASMEIEKLVEGPENVIDDSSIPRNDDQNIPGTRLEPRSDKESPEVEITNNEEVEITNVVIPVNVNEEEEEITDEVYELNRREKGKIELTVTDTTPTPSSSLLNTKLSTTNRLLSLFKANPARFKRYKSLFQELQECYGYLFGHLRAKFLSRKSFDTLTDHLQEVMVESLPTMHLASVEIEKMVEGPENVIDDSSIPRNDDQNIPGTRLEPRSDKESLEVEITNNEEVEITNVVIHVNVNEEEEEITDEVYELKRREKRKIVEESRNTPFPTPIRSPRIHTDLISSDTKKLQELTVTNTTPTPSSSSFNTKLST
ncbi:hypothetical protein Tco_1413207, partial [Tanacetum coccineum]